MRVVRWLAEDGHGLEHLVMERRHDGVWVESVVVGQRFGALYGLQYRIECDAHWAVRSATLNLTGGGSLTLRSDGAGHWCDGHEQALPELDGCIDIDISATPFTNTLPIQRLKLPQSERQFIRVAYISVPDLQVRAVEQAYTCVVAGREYTYEGIFRDFTATLKVDQDGIVGDYPTLFKRLR
jgi:uncharacterized protein